MSKLLSGVVLSTKMQNTIVVGVEKRYQHHLYKKIIIKHKKYKVHCEDKNVKEGDVVIIREVKPISKDKHFTLVTKGSDVKKEHEKEKTVKVEPAKEEKKVEVEKKVEAPVKKARTSSKKPAKKAAK